MSLNLRDIANRTSRSGLNYDVDLRRMHRLAIEMEAYLAKHPDDGPELWNPVNNQRDWSFVQDRFGKSIVGRMHALPVGKAYELNDCYVEWNGKRQTVKMFATVLRRVSMKEAMELARKKLPHKPFCYEVIVD